MIRDTSSAERGISAESAALRDGILRSLEDDKALHPVVVALPPGAVWADGLIIASGTSERHIHAMAEKLAPLLKERGVAGAKPEGQPASGWVLLDAGDWVVHLFRPEMRTLYDLEGLWGFAAEEGETRAAVSGA